MSRRDGGAFDDVERWAAEARAREAADSRVRERWLRRQAEEEATFAGVVVELARRELPALVTTTSDHHYRGRIATVGRDFLAVRAENARTTLVAIDAVASVAPAPGTPAALGTATEEALAVELTLADVLAQASGQRPRLKIQLGARVLVGELHAVGIDVLTVRVDADPPAAAYVRLRSVSEITLLDSFESG